MMHPASKFPNVSHGPHKRHRVAGVLVFAALVTALLVLPCVLGAMAYGRAFGRQVSIPVLFGLSVCWVIFVYAVIFILALLIRRRVHKKGHYQARTMFDDVMDALDSIAGGNYDVYVRRQGNYHYGELADKVNALARDLSSLEEMRQEFVSNVSHEIQSPLTSITGFATLLKKEELPREQRLHYLEVIEAESRRLSRLSENLLRLSMLDCDQPIVSPGPFRLDRQIQDCLLLLEPQWSEKGLEPDLDLERVTYTGDEELLSQVWINLLHNSIKFTPTGGSISARLWQENGCVICTLSDTGSGIPEDSQARIFERFYKVDKSRDRSLGGNGLGLSIVHKILVLHGGSISVDSTPGEGTSFTIALPIGEI